MPIRERKVRQPSSHPPSVQTNLLSLRKESGVIHLAINHQATFCGKDARPMQEVACVEEQLCQRCRTVRDTQTWWQGWREAFNDVVYQEAG